MKVSDYTYIQYTTHNREVQRQETIGANEKRSFDTGVVGQAH